MPTVIDRTAQTRNITQSRQGGKPIFSRSSRSGRRALSRINSIRLHQINFSRIGHDDRPNDDYDHTIAHFVVRQNGAIHRLRPYEAMLNNSRGGTSISIGFEGNFPNIRDRVYREQRFGRHALTPAQAFTGRDLIELIRQEVPDQITHIFGHMQFTTLAGRANCPVPHVWYNVGYWATRHLGLQSTGLGARNIPSDWENSRYDVVDKRPYCK